MSAGMSGLSFTLDLSGLKETANEQEQTEPDLLVGRGSSGKVHRIMYRGVDGWLDLATVGVAA